MTEETKRGPGRPPKADKPEEPKRAETVACRVKRDYWPTEHETDRVRAGTIVELAPMDAIEGIESGLFERVK